MAEYTGLREGGGTRSDNVGVLGGLSSFPRTPGPRTYSDPVLVDHSGDETHNGAEIYSNGSSIGISKGWSVYAKSGSTVFFFEDSLGTKQVGPSGGKGGQSNSPSRSGTVASPEYVGTFTGNATRNYLEVSWVNKWWQDAKINVIAPWNNKKGEFKTENKISWVKISDVRWQSDYVPAEQLQAQINQEKQLADALSSNNATTNAGLDPTTLGLFAVGAAFLLKKKKKRK